MAEKVVVFRDNQELQADDFINQQAWGQQALDHVVNDTITGGRAYWGFDLTKAAATTIKTSPGRLYNAGSIYAREDEVSVDLYAQLPVTARKYFAVVAWGQTVDEDIQPRNFLLDADTGMAEPQSVPMQRTRYCNVSTLAGTESADPQQPVPDATYTTIGYVLCDPAGILSVQQSGFMQVDNLALVGAGLRGMLGWRAIIDSSLATLRTDLANLAKQLLLYTPLSDFQKLVDLVGELWNLAHQQAPPSFKYYGTDRFLDTSQSDTVGNVDGAYAAQVNEGLRFPGGGAGWQGPLQLLNPSEPVIQSYDGFLLPRPSGSRVRYDCSFPNLPFVPVRILSFGYWTFNCKHLTPARWRYRCGPHFTPSPPAQVWWYQNQYDPTRILAFDTEIATWVTVDWGDTVAHVERSPYYPRAGWDRWNRYWRDWVDVDYWAKVYTDYSHSGNHCAQTFYNAQDGWLSGITLYSHKVLNQPITLVISGCTDDGMPDHSNQTLRRVVLDAAAVETCYGEPILAGDVLVPVVTTRTRYTTLPPAAPSTFPGQTWQEYAAAQAEVVAVTVEDGTETFVSYTSMPTYISPIRISFPPVFLRGGQHVAIHAHSTFDHEFSFCDQDSCYQVHQGHFWRHDGSAFSRWGPGPRTLRFLAHFATWGRWGDQTSPGGQLTYQINMQPLQLAGGIGSVDVLAEAIAPAATDLNFSVMVGGVWRKFEQDFAALSGSDALLPFRIELMGTTDLMPGISLTKSQVALTKAAQPTFHHISKPISLATATTSVKVTTRLNNYVEVHHNCNVSLHYGATNNTSGTAIDQMSDDGTTIMRTTTFTTASITSYVIKIDGATDGVGDNFFVSERITFAT
jgi:hypothetical protein